MFEEIEDILSELMLRERYSAQDVFLAYIVMEPFIRRFRLQGMSNRDILELCRKIDEANQDE